MIAIHQDSCSGCRDCARVCPHGVIEMREKRAFVVAQERCIGCGACQLNCHDDAVILTKGTGCLFLIIRDDILKLKSKDTCAQTCC